MKYKWFLALILLAILCAANAVPTYSGWITMTQPDGSSVLLKQMGDECYHYWVNHEGKEVVQEVDAY